MFAAELSGKVMVFLGLNETLLVGDQQLAGSSPFVFLSFPFKQLNNFSSS